MGKRRKQKRERNKVLLIVCEGQETEVLYFNNFRKQNPRGSGINFVIPNPKCTDPVNLVNYAAKFIKYEGLDLDFKNGDRVWVVFDADKNSDTKMRQAQKLAKQYNYELILSNPSFELWFLLHFVFRKRYFTNKELVTELKKHIPNYSKNQDIFQILLPHQNEAGKRARKLNESYEKDRVSLLSVTSNPSTQVFRIVEYISDLISG